MIKIDKFDLLNAIVDDMGNKCDNLEYALIGQSFMFLKDQIDVNEFDYDRLIELSDYHKQKVDKLCLQDADFAEISKHALKSKTLEVMAKALKKVLESQEVR